MRSAALALALVSVGCADPGVTSPTPIVPDIGTPQTLTVEATPTAVPYEGAPVNVVVVVTVEPGRRVQGVRIVYSLKSDDAAQPVTNSEAANAAGRVELALFVNRESDLTIRAGNLQRVVHISRGAAPAIPNPKPPPPPVPPPPPDPPQPPTPAPTLAMTVDVSPQVGATSPPSVNAGVAITFTMTVSELSGAPMPAAGVTYEWMVQHPDGTIETATHSGGDTDSIAVTFAEDSHGRTRGAGAWVTMPDGRKQYGRTDFVVLP